LLNKGIPEEVEQMNLKNKKSILLFISFSLLGAFVLYLAGCSGKSDFTLWGKFEGSNEDSNLAEFFSTIRPRPGNPDSHYLLAGYYQQRGQHREAIAEFKKVISIDPRYVEAYNGLGVSYDLLGQFGNALLSYETAISLDSSQAYLYNNLGYSWLMQENPDRAISAFQKAISLKPEELRFHNNLACAYAEKAQFQLAMEEFLRGGDEAQAHFNMAEIYFQKGIYAEASRNYTAALQLNPSKTLARTGAKAAETLASILGKTQKISASQAGTVIPESPTLKVEEKKVEKENSATAEYSLPMESQVAHTTVSAASVLNKPEIPVISLASLKMGKEDKRDREPVKVPGVTSTHMVDSNAGINRNGMEEWNYEMKMALLQGKAVPIELGVPKNAEKTWVAKKKDIRREVGIEVSNGNGVNQMAKRVGIYLRKKGYQVDRLTNSKPFNHGQTRIYYQEGNWETALGLADELPIYYDFIELKRLDRPSIQVKIVLGKDMIPYDNKFREKEGS
jgi:tetratricopeptide (TPR) repeat protein